jgi:IS30 family transposase
MYTQFTKERRIELAAFLKAGNAPRECARLLGMDKSAVTRELARNGNANETYHGAQAHRRYLKRRELAKASSRKIENDPDLQQYIQMRLRERDSPEQIAGRMKRAGLPVYICHETIYHWIFQEMPEAKQYLRRISTKGKYRRKRGTRQREKQRDEATVKRIDTRPALVEKRTRIGDWEGDTIIGKEKTMRLLTNVDRKSGFGMIDKLAIVSSQILHAELQKRFARIPKYKRYTYTYDNGAEIGKEDADLEQKIGMDVYRAYPYHSWERGCNENYNGLIRDFFPKGTDFATITRKEVRRVERNLNHRPRKRLGYLTPHEVFMLGMEPGAVQARM